MKSSAQLQRSPRGWIKGIGRAAALVIVLLAGASNQFESRCCAAELTSREVRKAVAAGRESLIRRQLSDGSFPADGLLTHPIAVTAWATLASLESGLPADSLPIRRALAYLRGLPLHRFEKNAEISLTIIVLLAGRDREDLPRVGQLVELLQSSQASSGAWTAAADDPTDHASISLLALLALRDAVHAGLPVHREVWLRSRQFWHHRQNPDGSWGEAPADHPEDSVVFLVEGATLTAVAALMTSQQMLDRAAIVMPDGSLDCCRTGSIDPALERGRQWLRSRALSQIQAESSSIPIIYYLYGLERTGRLSGLSFRGEQDWYRNGAALLLARQSPADGSWKGNNPVVATSHALLFLSRGLSSTVVCKLLPAGGRAAPSDGATKESWNRHPCDVGNLAQMVRGRPRWPLLMAADEADLSELDFNAGFRKLRQSPVVFLTGDEPPELSPREQTMLREYLAAGGFLLACPTCSSPRFEDGFRKLVRRILPVDQSELRPLSPDHPVYFAEFRISPADVTLLGVDAGCRTPVLYCPDDLGCLWSLWTSHQPGHHSADLQRKIDNASQIGINILSYATGREPPARLDVVPNDPVLPQPDHERGTLQIAQLRHAGAWQTAPRALPNLQRALAVTAGLPVSTTLHSRSPGDHDLFRFPILIMHGRQKFQYSPSDVAAIRNYLRSGGVLVADACCGSPEFDRSFRELAVQLFGATPLEPIPLEHELFSSAIGHDLKSVRFRELSPDGSAGTDDEIRRIGPQLEGIPIGNRYAVIYSRYDLSCTLERQFAAHCTGYLPDDAVRIATNLVLYALLQDVAIDDETPVRSAEPRGRPAKLSPPR